MTGKKKWSYDHIENGTDHLVLKGSHGIEQGADQQQRKCNGRNGRTNAGQPIPAYALHEYGDGFSKRYHFFLSRNKL